MVNSQVALSMYALADCNNFFVSCERVFEPQLENRPVMVLSNNDGCVVARSQEVKAIGIGMGEPVFKCQKIIERHNIVVRSSNFALYGDMSSRIMHTLRLFTPDVEVYSIDEAFLDLTGLTGRNVMHEMQRMRATVLQWTGIPISIGIGPTKTLAKLANHYAKYRASSGGVACIPSEEEDRNDMLREVDVGDIWGVGRRWSKKLHDMGIHTALDLTEIDGSLIRDAFNVVALRTVLELRGRRCFYLEQSPEQRKTMVRSRSFGEPVLQWQEMSEAIATHVTRAAEKLRNEGLVARILRVFIHTSVFSKTDARYSGQATIELVPPTNVTTALIKAALGAGKTIWKQGYRYKRAGVYLTELSNGPVQGSLFDTPQAQEQDKRVMSVLDAVNASMGGGTLRFAASGFSKKPWHMRQLRRSPRYTTRWDELPIVKCRQSSQAARRG